MKKQTAGYGWVVLGLAVCLGVIRPVAAEITEPSARDRYVTMTVTALMRQMHIAKREIDQEISARTLENMLKTLDPQKIYFYQSDVDAFKKYEEKLGDWFRSGRIEFAYTVFKTYLARMDERIAMIMEQLKQPADFTLNEEMITDRDTLVYPKNQSEARERVRQRVKYELLLLKVDEIKDAKAEAKKEAASAETPAPTAEAAPAETAPVETPEEKQKKALEKLEKRYTSFSKRMHQMDADEVLEMYITAMTTGFDPHTSYMAPSTQENFDIAMRLELDGIGASLSSEDGYVVVKRLVPGGAAEKEGTLKVDDKITSVGQGTDGEMEDVVDMKLDDVVKKIRGKRDTIVRLEYQRGNEPRKIAQITRSKIELKDSEAKGDIFEVDGKKIGVINLPSFYMDMEGAKKDALNYKSTTRDVREILRGFQEKGVEALVMDLRSNGGGSLQESISLTGLFIDQGTVVQVRDSADKKQAYKDTLSGKTWQGPLVVVVNKLSASASEIFAGAIQDYKRGLIVGDKTTHGKGTVQTMMDLSDILFQSDNSMKLGALKVTIQQFYRPLGDSTQNRGVESDIEIPSITTHMDLGEADLDNPMPFDKIEAQPIESEAQTTPEMITSLREMSQKRIAGVEDFQKLLKKIDFYCSQKDRKSVTLNLEKYMAEQSDILEEEQEELAEKEITSANEIKRDFYLDEVFHIMVDYMGALSTTK